MRVPGTPTALRPCTAILCLGMAVSSQAQTLPIPAEEIPDDYYRAELVIIERKMAPEEVNERMAIHPANLTEELESQLQVVDQDGNQNTTLEVVPREELHLNSAMKRLEQSGRYNVLAFASWYQAYPPDYEGETMQVAVGDWLEEPGHREVEGTITIDRQRYLHVDVQLNHWQPAPSDGAPLMGPPRPVEPGTSDGETAEPATESAVPAESAPQANTEMGIAAEPKAAELARSAELLTWIRETRRMRSEEVHFLDSPTIGVMVYFSPVEQVEQSDPEAP